MVGLFAYAFVALLLSNASVLAQNSNYTVPPGSPGFYQGNSSAAVTFDQHSLLLDNKRLFVFSGEFHPWRSPSGPATWRDVLQKMKAGGFNAVSVYHHWGLVEQKPGELNFDQYRSHSDFYQVAKEVGILVVVRPGPYINAETTGGGFPGWLTNVPATARTNQTGYTNAWRPYIAAAAKAAAPFQYPDGPVIAVQSENEFFPSTPTDPGRSEHMVLIEQELRNNGITKVPITHNDAGTNGFFASGLGQVDLYLWDSYPNNFLCSMPEVWSEVRSTLDQAHLSIDPAEPWAAGEFQGGSFDPWGGSGYDACFDLTNEQFANVFYKNNYAAGTVWQNLYMTQGGTNWGNLAEPTVYTSYDYGAPIREDRTLSPKHSEIKLQALFLHASPPFLVSNPVASGTTFSSNPLVFTTQLNSENGTNFYVVRQTTNKNTSPVSFSLRVNTTSGPVTIPQLGGNITLDGRESKIIVTNYKFGLSELQYSTAEITTWTTIDKTDYIVLYALTGQTIEAVLPHASGASPHISGSSSIKATVYNGTLAVTGSPSGISIVRAGSTAVIVADKRTALSFWNPRVESRSSAYDVAPDVPSVLVFGPYLVRNASISGNTLALLGDINTTTSFDIIAPSLVKHITWNGKSVKTDTSELGTLQGILPFTVTVPTLPNLKKMNWACTDSLPEIQEDYDDSNWVKADKTNTSRPYQPFEGKFILYADEYGFHSGNTLYRGHFKGNATGVSLSVQGGFNFAYTSWINSDFLFSNQGTNQYSANGGTDLVNDTLIFPEGSLKKGDNVLTVLLDQTGLEEDYNGEDTFKTPRGIRGYKLNGAGDFDNWKIAGNFKGEDGPDKVRGPLNEGGLFVEREGAHLPGFSTHSAGWVTGASCNPLAGISTAGIKAFRTNFTLDLPLETDIPLALNFTRTLNSRYRSVIFINGWQFGRFNSADGPQAVFPLPDGILNSRGNNELLITLWSLDSDGAKIADVELISTASFASSKERGMATSPTFHEIRG